MINGSTITKINNKFEFSKYLIEISDKTKIKNTYIKTLKVFNVKLFSSFEKVNKKQHINVKSGKYIGLINLL